MLTINGRSYEVEPKFCEEDGICYYLKGKRGAVYYTLRNKKDPHLMFLVNARTMDCSNVWLTDEDGELRYVR